MTDIVEIKPSAPGDPDWSVLEIEGVQEVAEKAARKVAFDYSVAIEFDDALQEAFIFLASRPSMVRACLADATLGLGVLHTRIYRGLRDVVRTEADRRIKHVSYEASREGRE